MSVTRSVLSDIRLFKLSESKHNLALVLTVVEQKFLLIRVLCNKVDIGPAWGRGVRTAA